MKTMWFTVLIMDDLAYRRNNKITERRTSVNRIINGEQILVIFWLLSGTVPPYI